MITIHFFCIYFSGAKGFKEYYHVTCTAVVSLLVSGLLNFLQDRRLRLAENQVNDKLIEKFVFSNKHRSFHWSDWGSISIGDVIKINQNQEIPCDALILNITGSKQEAQTCYQRGSLWDDSKNMMHKKSYQGTMNKTNNYISESKFVSQISGLVKWEYNNFGLVSGSFKQPDNAAAIDFLPENIVQRGCYFTQAASMIGLALNVGTSSIGNDLSPDKTVTFESKFRAFLQ